MPAHHRVSSFRNISLNVVGFGIPLGHWRQKVGWPRYKRHSDKQVHEHWCAPNINPKLRMNQTFDNIIPVKGCSSAHVIQLTRRGSTSRNRSSSEICDSSGSIVVSVGFIGPIDRNWRGSNPRHSAILAESVQSMGAHNRSIGGRICFAK